MEFKLEKNISGPFDDLRLCKLKREAKCVPVLKRTLLLDNSIGLLQETMQGDRCKILI